MEGDYYKTKESVAEYVRLAKDVDGHELIEKLKAILPVKSKVLELGSGPGSDWRILQKHYQSTGSDNSPEFLEHLQTQNPKGEFLLLDAVSLATDEKFDAIYANKVMHHLSDSDLKVSLKRQSEILHSQGLVCHSYWKGKGSEIFKGLFVNYHTKAGLHEVYQDSFEIISIQAYEEFEEGDSLLVLAKRKSD